MRANYPILFLATVVICGCPSSTPVPSDDQDTEHGGADQEPDEGGEIQNEDNESDPSEPPPDEVVEDEAPPEEEPVEIECDDSTGVLDCLESLSPAILAEPQIASAWWNLERCFTVEDTALLQAEVACLPFPIGERDGWGETLEVAYTHLRDSPSQGFLYIRYRGVDFDACNLGYAGHLYGSDPDDYLGCVPEELLSEYWELIEAID